MVTMYLKVRSWFQREEGQDLSEYALLIGLIALVTLGAVTVLGEEISGVFSGIAAEVGTWF